MKTLHVAVLISMVLCANLAAAPASRIFELPLEGKNPAAIEVNPTGDQMVTQSDTGIYIYGVTYGTPNRPDFKLGKPALFPGKVMQMQYQDPFSLQVLRRQDKTAEFGLLSTAPNTKPAFKPLVQVAASEFMRFSVSSNKLAISSGNVVHFWERTQDDGYLPDDETVELKGPIYSMEISPDGRWLAAATMFLKDKVSAETAFWLYDTQNKRQWQLEMPAKRDPSYIQFANNSLRVTVGEWTGEWSLDPVKAQPNYGPDNQSLTRIYMFKDYKDYLLSAKHERNGFTIAVKPTGGIASEQRFDGVTMITAPRRTRNWVIAASNQRKPTLWVWQYNPQ